MDRQVDEKTRQAVNALIRKQVKKERRCLKCCNMFMSNDAGHRICNICGDSEVRYGIRAEGVS